MFPRLNERGSIEAISIRRIDDSLFAAFPRLNERGSIEGTSSGGTGSVNVTTGANCNWTATSSDAWITINSGSSGTGNGTVGYTIASNTGINSRTGTIAISGQNLTITQSAPTYTINGRVTDSDGGSISGVTVSLGGSQTSSTQTDGSGNYSFVILSAGTHTFTPPNTNYTFSPTN